MDWQMKFNPKNVNFLGLGSYPLPEVSFIKYVGVTIDNQLSWNEHIKNNQQSNIC